MKIAVASSRKIANTGLVIQLSRLLINSCFYFIQHFEIVHASIKNKIFCKIKYLYINYGGPIWPWDLMFNQKYIMNTTKTVNK